MDFPPNPKDKPGYRLEFSDEFEGSELDGSRWFPHMLPHWSSLEASAARYNLGGGMLKLRIEPDQGRWIAGGDRASNLQTGHFSGVKGSAVGQFRYDPGFVVTQDIPPVRNYLPQFGYFETRLKAVPVVGYHVALWTIGFEQEQAGEIRIFEIHGANIQAQRSRIDHGILRWNDPKLLEECYEDWVDINAAEFHVYGLEWTPTHVDFYLDNQKLRTVRQSPQYPMQFMFGIYERPHEVLKHSLEPWPRVLEVDYFRGYQPLAGYP